MLVFEAELTSKLFLRKAKLLVLERKKVISVVVQHENLRMDKQS